MNWCLWIKVNLDKSNCDLSKWIYSSIIDRQKESEFTLREFYGTKRKKSPIIQDWKWENKNENENKPRSKLKTRLILWIEE